MYLSDYLGASSSKSMYELDKVSSGLLRLLSQSGVLDVAFAVFS